MQKGNSAGEWPLVGRAEELAFLRRLRRTGPGTSAFISGDAGTGKSRLAHEALDEAAGEGWATLALRGSAGYAGIPLGPFRTVLELEGSADLTELNEAVVRRLEAMRSAQGLLLLSTTARTSTRCLRPSCISSWRRARSSLSATWGFTQTVDPVYHRHLEGRPGVSFRL